MWFSCSFLQLRVGGPEKQDKKSKRDMKKNCLPQFFLRFLCCGNFLLVDHSLENTMINNLCCIFFLQTVRALGKMRFNKSEVAALALGQPSHKFEKEGVLFVREKQEGFFRRTESKIFRISNRFILY